MRVWSRVIQLNPSANLALGISAADDKPRLYRRRLDGNLTTLATAASGLGLTNGQWYEAKVVITESGGNQLLNFYVDTNQDSDFEDEGEHVLTDRGEVDDNWSAGYVGLYRAPGGSSAQEFDDLKVGYDNNSDGDIDDAGDDIGPLTRRGSRSERVREANMGLRPVRRVKGGSTTSSAVTSCR